MANILNYIKTVWRAGREGGTSWTPSRLNNIENGIEQATNQINQNSQDIETINSNLINRIYPVGSIYMSVNNTNPSSFFGGTWVSWGSGRVPVGVNTSDTNFNTVEKTGGASSNSHTPSGTVNGTALTVNQIPSHSHVLYGSPNTASTYANSVNASIVGNTKFAGTGTVGSTGGGQSHSHGFTGTATNISTLQPYITCYMWKRTA